MDFRDLHPNRRFEETVPLLPTAESEETLVSDARAGLTPAQMVERKLATLLQSAPLPVSNRLVTAATQPASL